MFSSKFSVKNVSPGEQFYKNLSRQVNLLNAITQTKNFTYIRTGDKYILCSNTDGKQWKIKYIAEIDHQFSEDKDCVAIVRFKMAQMHRWMVRFVIAVALSVFILVSIFGVLWLDNYNLGLVRLIQFLSLSFVVGTLIYTYVNYFLMEKRIKTLISMNQNKPINFNDNLIIE